MKRQKRLAIFLSGLYGGGAERTMLNLAEGIAKRGYAVDLVLARAVGPYLSQVPKSVKVIDLSGGRTMINRLHTLRSLPVLVRYLRNEQPDAMLSAQTIANLVALCARRVAGLPKRVVVNQQNTLSKHASQSPNRFFRLAPQFARYFYRWADCIVGVSQGVVEDLVQVVGIHEKHVKVIYNPGITPQLREKAQAPLEHPWFQPGQPPVLLAIGRLDKQKDFETLIAAFARLRKFISTRLVILGEGPKRPTLEALVRKLNVEQDVSLPGFVDNPYTYMSRAAVFVLSSLWEGLPTVLVEALYCCASIVSTDCPSGPREILKDGQLGYLTPMRNYVLLAEAIQAAIVGKVPRPPRASWQPYALETVVDQYIDLLLREDQGALH